MTPVTVLKGRTVALFGLGGSGLATLRALEAGGSQVHAWDDGEASRAKAAGEGATLVDLSSADWSAYAAFVLAPGVPLTHPAPHWTVERARAAGVETIGDVELFCRERAAAAPGSPFVAITGTNGKSTTTALIAHILRDAGRNAQMGGNIGTAILVLEPPAPERVHVVECSSYQIDLAPSLKASVGVHLNLTPDHLDRHGSVEAYAAVKERLVESADLAVVGVDDVHSEAMAERRAGSGRPLVRVSVERRLARGMSVEGSRLVRDGAVVADLEGVGSLRGAHNAQNAAAAFAACEAVGLTEGEIQRGLRSFPGLAHRMEQVGRVGPVLFVNDSKATNADAAEKALLSFQDIHWIVGGLAKEGGIEPLGPLFGRVARAYLVGVSSADFARTLEGRVPYAECGTMERAVALAVEDARASGRPEPIVLLAPACASFDQFPNFEVRGDRFRDLVRALPGFTPFS